MNRGSIVVYMHQLTGAMNNDACCWPRPQAPKHRQEKSLHPFSPRPVTLALCTITWHTHERMPIVYHMQLPRDSVL